MTRSTRLFDIIQILRQSGAPITARAIADELEVTPRTIYRDIACLQAMRVPVEGAAGIGYVMRAGFDLPPLMFTAEEVEAIVVGLAHLRRSGDAGLERAARRAAEKISEVLPEAVRHPVPLHVSGWNTIPEAGIGAALIRRAIREEAELRLTYVDAKDARTVRDVLPLALIYYIDALVLAAWCGFRRGFRHFRLDRIEACEPTGARFTGQGDGLRRDWERETDLP